MFGVKTKHFKKIWIICQIQFGKTKLNHVQMYIVELTWKEVQMLLLLGCNSLNLLPVSHNNNGSSGQSYTSAILLLACNEKDQDIFLL